MRNRMVCKEIMESNSMASVSEGAELFFILLLMYSDDEGKCKGNFKVMRNFIYANRDEVTVSVMRGYITELAEVGCVRVLNKDGQCILTVPNFLDYQSISRPSKSKVDIEGAAPAQVDDFDDRGIEYEGVWNE